jgi:hypothetical protein
MRRFMFVALSVALVLVLGGQPTRAAAPERIPIPPFHDRFDAGVVCPFAVAVDQLRINERLTILSNGRVFLTGNSVQRITNLDSTTLKSVVVNASGPFTLTDADGVQTFVARGRNIFTFFQDALGPGQPPAMLVTTGLAIYTVSPSGGITFTHNVGTTENLCVTLAD